jgi:AraC family transcriptional activator of tynA and feaB
MDKILAMSELHPRDRLAYWYDVACKVFVKHECRVEKPPAFDATIHRATLGELGIVEVDSLGLSYAAVTARNIANEEDDVFLLGLQLEGSATLIQDGREAILQPGDFALLDAQRPFFTHYSAKWRRLFIKIPHRSLKARLAPSSQLTARAVRRGPGISGLVSDYLRMIPQHIGALEEASRAQIGEQVLDLAAIALAAEGAKDRPALSSARATALLRLRTEIERRLPDPALDPETAAGAAGISVRYANALLAEEGLSIERLIVQRRLERCRHALSDATQAHRTIGEIAYGWGFSDLSHFTRRFKAAFGCAPSDYRRQHVG